MAANGYDSTDGSPLFSDSDAPDIKVDPRAVAIYAAEVGNRIMKANIAGLEAYPFKRKGLAGVALDTNVDYKHDGTGWVQTGESAPVNISTFGPGFSAVDGFTPRVRRVGSRVFLFGAVQRAGATGSGGNLLTVPAGYAPATATNLSAVVVSTGQGVQLQITAAGVLAVTYGTASLGSGALVPLAGSWYVN